MKRQEHQFRCSRLVCYSCSVVLARCCAFHFANSFCPSSLSIKACISGSRTRARASILFFRINLLLTACKSLILLDFFRSFNDTRTTSSRTAYRSRRRFLFQSKRHLSLIPSLLLSKSQTLRWFAIWFWARALKEWRLLCYGVTAQNVCKKCRRFSFP